MNIHLFSDLFSKTNTEISIIVSLTLPAGAFISITYTPSGRLNQVCIFEDVNVY